MLLRHSRVADAGCCRAEREGMPLRCVSTCSNPLSPLPSLPSSSPPDLYSRELGDDGVDADGQVGLRSKMQRLESRAQVLAGSSDGAWVRGVVLGFPVHRSRCASCHAQCTSACAGNAANVGTCDGAEQTNYVQTREGSLRGRSRSTRGRGEAPGRRRALVP